MTNPMVIKTTINHSRSNRNASISYRSVSRKRGDLNVSVSPNVVSNVGASVGPGGLNTQWYPAGRRTVLLCSLPRYEIVAVHGEYSPRNRTAETPARMIMR